VALAEASRRHDDCLVEVRCGWDRGGHHSRGVIFLYGALPPFEASSSTSCAMPWTPTAPRGVRL